MSARRGRHLLALIDEVVPGDHRWRERVDTLLADRSGRTAKRTRAALAVGRVAGLLSIPAPPGGTGRSREQHSPDLVAEVDRELARFGLGAAGFQADPEEVLDVYVTIPDLERGQPVRHLAAGIAQRLVTGRTAHDLRGLLGPDEPERYKVESASADPEMARDAKQRLARFASQLQDAFRQDLEGIPPGVEVPLTLTATAGDFDLASSLAQQTAARLDHPVFLQVGGLPPLKICPDGPSSGFAPVRG
jgi:hypothetical protein